MAAVVSHALAAVIRDVFGKLEDKRLRDMAGNCLMSTLDTTVRWVEGDEPFVITGDISAMWLRDSSSQVEPYVRFVKEDAVLRALIAGVIRRQVSYILQDPYANAFNEGPNHIMGFPHDITDKNPWVFERKFELDSLCHPLRLWWMYWRVSGDGTMFTPDMRSAIRSIIDVMKMEQDHAARSSYSFQRLYAPSSDTLVRTGKGSSVGVTGMVWSGFRPSDDACQYHYLIPAQMFAVVSLGMLAELFEVGFDDEEEVRRAMSLKADIEKGIAQHATVNHDRFGGIWAYEVDGLEGHLLMDDANVPSLLSLPYLGYCAPDHPQYLRTRQFVLSRDNPYFYSGKFGAGVGSPHTPKNRFWPIAVIMQALTSTSDAEKAACIDILVRTDADTGLMHESIDADDPNQFSRPWFAWANSLFAELMLRSLGVEPIIEMPVGVQAGA